jgi:hypothetical protein
VSPRFRVAQASPAPTLVELSSLSTSIDRALPKKDGGSASAQTISHTFSDRPSPSRSA